MSSVDALAFIGLAYLSLLFLIAYFGDKGAYSAGTPYNSNLVYALSLAVYCSSWTFYGAVGSAAVDGLDYLTIYLGPILVFLFGYPMVRRIILICKQNSITTISDFLSSRYGKSRRIAVLVTVIAVAGSLPYIALQLKAVSTSYYIISGTSNSVNHEAAFIADNVAFIVAAGLVLFTILFGTRHLDATEHHKGMILAVAFESVVKLVAILAIGYYAIYLLLSSENNQHLSSFVDTGSLQSAVRESGSTWASFTTKLILSMTAIILLPRQFQVTVVEARDHNQFKTAIWVMPVYLMLTSIIVLPIALSGLVLQPSMPADMYVLSLPLSANNSTLATLAFIGGLSAATGMVIVASISLSTMICNDWVMPTLIRRKGIDFLKRNDLNSVILSIRRYAILGIMIAAYGYYLLIDTNAQLANIGLVSFAAIFQLLPATLFALFWRGANGKAIFYGLVGGFAVWLYTLILPTLIAEETIGRVFDGSIFHPQALFGFRLDNSLTHGVLWSLGINLALSIFFSLRERQPLIETIQANRFFFSGVKRQVDGQRPGQDLAYEISQDALFTIAERIIGTQSSSALFAEYQRKKGKTVSSYADRGLISAVQTAIAGVIGTASAQRVISDALLGDQEYLGELTNLVDETSSVLKFNRNLLQTTLQNITHGISVVDDKLNLVVWNDTYLKMFDYPESMIYVGKPIREVYEFSAERGDFEGKDSNSEIEKRLNFLRRRSSYTTVRENRGGVVIKAIGEPMPEGGFVTTYEDITESVEASRLLERANLDLEKRVQERTEELESMTRELERNTQSKTHFLAAASHDLLQPINAARLFTYSVSERAINDHEIRKLAESIDKSLATANDLLRALLDISKLDAGGIEPEPKLLSLVEFLGYVESELQASANDKRVTLSVETSSLYIFTDRQLLFSVLLNLVSNALRYTPEGGLVKVVAEELPNELVRISVKDTGVGIEPEHLDEIFTEFFQVKDQNRRNNKGLGLGLSIVKRICELLETTISVESNLGEGSCFSIVFPKAEAAKLGLKQNEPKTSLLSSKLLGTRVLCLDNDTTILEAMDTMLTGWGCTVCCVDSYRNARKIVQVEEFDIALVDYRLDFDETGLDFLSYCKQKNLALNGILITAEQDKTLKAKASDIGFMYLPKPIEPASLRSLLTYLISSD